MTGLATIDQRYYASSYGRFNTADPLASSADPNTPGSWNRYNYTLGDPVNSIDPTGTNGVIICGLGADDGCGSGLGGWDVPGANGYAGLNPCLQISDALFGGSVFCGSPGNTLAFAPPQPTQPSCSVEVGYIPNVFGTTFSHSFFDIDYYGSSEYIEVSPSLSGIIPTMQVNFTSTGVYNDSTQGIDYWNETGPNACLDAAGIVSYSSHLGPSLYLGLISNSNSFVSWILGDIGATALPLVGGSSNAIGWGMPVLPVPILGAPLPRPRPVLPRLL